MKKILVIRFSSIGDIVLTTPVVRCLKKQIPDSVIHYCTKKQYASTLQANPYIDGFQILDDSLFQLANNLKAEKYDLIVDLQGSLRTRILKLLLRRSFTTFPKLNFRKWLLVNFKINVLPKIHIVDRYFRTVAAKGVVNDGLGLDYFIPSADEFNPEWLPASHQSGYIGFVIGGRHHTKIFPGEKVMEVCRLINYPVVLLGGKEDYERAHTIKCMVGEKVFNACGKFSVNRSAAIVKNASLIITNDTGLMHIAAAFHKKIIAIWGNTLPDFGMYPYLPSGHHHTPEYLEINNLGCRPCSKLGFKACPKRHFNCMRMIDNRSIASIANSFLNKKI